MEPVKNASTIRYYLESALEESDLVNEKYQTVSTVFYSSYFVNVCQWAGWEPNKASAMTMRANGSRNLFGGIQGHLENAVIEAAKSNSKKLIDTIMSAKGWAKRAEENCLLALHSQSESEYEQYMTWALNQNKEIKKELRRAIALLK